MPEFFLELFSEEIPARMQEGAAEKLLTICESICGKLSPDNFTAFYGPRRLAVSGTIAAEQPSSSLEERGPRDSAPEQALAGFLRKHNATREELLAEGGYYILRRNQPPISARQVLIEWLPRTLAVFSWPKSMRWGSSGDFTWVRPLRRITCLLDGEVIPITLGPITASNETEGHRIHGPGPFAVSSAATWQERLWEHRVIADQADRKTAIQRGLTEKAAALGLTLAPDESLLDEVTGLVEWPIPLIGRIDDAFMDLPWEVRELSMRTNQKYFALRDATGAPAPYFAFIANLEAEDGGAAIIAGNERVLRARLADARHFWDLDLKTPLEDLLPKLEKITFHAKIGTQRQRAERISARAQTIAQALLTPPGADASPATPSSCRRRPASTSSGHPADAPATDSEVAMAAYAGKLCKADLVTFMVGEFPELQGIMGGYYAARNPHCPGAALIGAAISTHYQPKGPSDAVPQGIVPVSVALADKLDTLVEFFRINEKPTGSGDPYALRRCALGVIRIILENGLRLNLKSLLDGDEALFDFLIERLRVKLRSEGKRFDILDAVLSAGADDDLVRVMKRVDALTDALTTEDGKNLLAAYKRAANIIAKETAKTSESFDEGEVDEQLLSRPECRPDLELNQAILEAAGPNGLFKHGIATEDFGTAMRGLSRLRAPIDAFFEKVTVNAPEPELRRNRLRLLSQFVGAVQQVADFTKIEG